mmetsp:Transcript_27438/g.40275  ORF Transcript_27438/g.40275 Transcript_27438/m.40275 type:complete len:170 (-) Transcript_27438:1525-2034(-)
MLLHLQGGMPLIGVLASFHEPGCLMILGSTAYRKLNILRTMPPWGLFFGVFVVSMDTYLLEQCNVDINIWFFIFYLHLLFGLHTLLQQGITDWHLTFFARQKKKGVPVVGSGVVGAVEVGAGVVGAGEVGAGVVGAGVVGAGVIGFAVVGDSLVGAPVVGEGVEGTIPS